MTVSEAVGADARAIEKVYRARQQGFRNALATVTGSYDSAHDAVQADAVGPRALLLPKGTRIEARLADGSVSLLQR